MPYPVIEFGCWRCDTLMGITRVGLCERCSTELRTDRTTPPPPHATLHPHGTLPEEIR